MNREEVLKQLTDGAKELAKKYHAMVCLLYTSDAADE